MVKFNAIARAAAIAQSKIKCENRNYSMIMDVQSADVDLWTPWTVTLKFEVVVDRKVFWCCKPPKSAAFSNVFYVKVLKLLL